MEIPAQLIRSKAPLRLSFAGGGTDVRPYADQEGGCVLNATITRYAWGSLTPRADSQIQIESADFNSLVRFEAGGDLVYDGKMDLAKAAIRNLCGQSSAGFDLFLHTDAPPGSGLGSSSSLMVSLVGLFREYQGLPLSDYDTAQLAYSIEREQLGIRGGMQDQYAASFGGFNFTEFYADRVIVNPLRISQDTINELEHNLLLCYTGRPRAGGGIIDDQVARYEKREEDALTGLRRQRELAFEMKNALLERRLDDFGALLGLAWRYKKKMSPRISTPAIDEMYEVGMRHGAIGGKITGAGAGGYMLFYCRYEKRLRVAEALRAMGATPTEFGFEPRGLQTWRAGERRVYPRPNTGETASPSWRLVAAHSPS